MQADAGEPSEHLVALAVTSQVVLLAATLMLSHVASRHNVTWIGEAGIALLLGLCVGGGVAAFDSGSYTHMIGFRKDIFFLAILPPIMFEAGFRLDVDRFFANLDGIAAFAFAGTAISSAAMGGLVWAAGAAGLCLPLSPLHALLFGSIVSATDPVTVLAVFQRLRADPDLYSMVFGESVLNDAVAMVLFTALARFLNVPVTPTAIAEAAASFLGIFLGSVVVGAATALCTAMLVKGGYFRSKHAPLESSLVVLSAYASYTLADALHLSGIVSILSCGVFMARYVRPNLTPASRDRVGAFFKLFSTLAETFVFVYIGASLFTDQGGLELPTLLPFLAVSFGALAVSRALNIWPCAALVNGTRPAEHRIPQRQLFMMWWSGLRGAMAFAIALEAADMVPGAGRIMLSATFFIILATVLVNGGSAAWMLERLRLRAEHQLPVRHASVGDGEEGAVGEELLEETLLSGSAAADSAATSAEQGTSADWKRGQLRSAIRESGLLRQLTLDNSFLAAALLDPNRAATEAPSIAGDMMSVQGSQTLPGRMSALMSSFPAPWGQRRGSGA